MNAKRDRGLLAQAAAERGGDVVAACCEADLLEQFLGVFLPVGDAVQSSDELEVLPQRQIVVERRRVAEPRQQAAGLLAARA